MHHYYLIHNSQFTIYNLPLSFKLVKEPLQHTLQWADSHVLAIGSGNGKWDPAADS